MMQTPALRTCDEYDPLEAHLDELEEPGTSFLQDFIVARQLIHNDTPLSISNGYTSEESDCSVVTPSDEYDYQDVSFLQTQKTNEFVDGVSDIIPEDLAMMVTCMNQQNAAVKVIKGKTSKYRGVTQTSKTSWGAKYSAKRITNICKTPEEAAHAYDEYLKVNHPHKFSKFANFCHNCGKFVNPLRLPQYQSECGCPKTSYTEFSVSEPSLMSPKKEVVCSQQIMTSTPTTSMIPPMALSPAGRSSALSTDVLEAADHFILDLNPADEKDECVFDTQLRNMPVSSFKSSLMEETEQSFADSFNYAATVSLDRDNTALVDEQQQQDDRKCDSLPMAVISMAGDLFTQEDNLDQIIKDIDCSSLSHSLLKCDAAEECIATDSVDSDTITESSGESGRTMNDLNNHDMLQVKPSTSNSLDYDMGELDELAIYFLSENNDAEHEMHPNSDLTHQNLGVMQAQQAKLKKMHSLDFDSNNDRTSGSCSGNVISDVKLEKSETMDTFLVPPVDALTSLVGPAGSPAQAIINIQTRFLEKYWRNDRKNIQCFPYCPEHGDYYRVRIENLQHRCKGVCRAPVKAHVSISALAGASVAQPKLLVLARCNSIYSRQAALTEQQSLTKQQSLSLAEMKSLQDVSAVGVIDHFASVDNGGGGVHFGVTFHPDVWKFEFDLPKKRRYQQSANRAMSSHKTDGDVDGDPLAAEFLYFFEIDVFYSLDNTTFERLGHIESTNFQIGNTRTLLRQRNKMVGEPYSIGGLQTHAGQKNDSDKLADADDIPEKKKVKVYLGQRENLSGDDGTQSDRGMAGRKLPMECVKDDGISFLPKQLLHDTTIPMDVGIVNSGVLKSVDGVSDYNQQTAATSDYHPYVSPRHTSDNNLMTDVPAVTEVPVKVNTSARPSISTSSATMESYSLHKLLCYAFECVPLSVLLFPVGVLLLLGFLVVPPAALGIVSVLDSLSDMELSRANRSCISRDQRFVLNRLVEENLDMTGTPNKGGIFRYHGKNDVWGRMLYFCGAKFVLSMVSLMPAFVLALIAGLLFPLRPVSTAIANSACRCVLWSREYTRMTTGKRLAGVAEHGSGGLV